MCNVCRHVSCVPGCPNYDPEVDELKSEYYCSICGDKIFPGDSYYENYNGEYIHEECASDIPLRKLLRWFGENPRVLYKVGD